MLKTARKQEKDPEGRMPLADHLRELRNRLFKSVLAIIVITVVAAFFYKDIIHLLQQRIPDGVQCRTKGEAAGKVAQEACAQMTVSGLMGGFSIALKVSLMAGVVGASPIWLYQLWGFLAPGLHKNEKRYTLGFVGAGVPLFLGGAVLAYEILPQTARIMIGFVPDDTTNLLPLDDFLDLVVRLVIVFGLAFELPLVLVLLNFTGMVTGKRMLGWWRGMVIGITVFAAVATPTGDPLTMCLLAAPIVLLYFMALGVCFFNDSRRARRRAADPDFALDPDQASSLDHIPEQIDADSSLDDGRGDDYDDAT
ncbi:twin-arginine translocase subunit TatC [Actinacidiphila bryophytorum]|uniref:Sec-independent protein translocase protein TatC n=1 Tax=Actinacidiphila bryophytorum TaxID=1436133 RepID=A0A9W4H7W2_9ACTN|nr:twin-arginine translocase subunit TatC [Actinacidiphila bryophytorum]MBM9437753.1 twin-arginine translocase subunit TatC [Actinacidiphila bryophytorum]MBN6545112.1 twin-arginine translocase subunit TatC [Actinacidiphila bryophytorum]CAG7656835.1 Sec-independent protein translocase protein TatC [Actinacidiphila bryophytorum]